MTTTKAILERQELERWCSVNLCQPWADVRHDCPACPDYYPVVDTDGDLTGEIADAADTNYQSYRGDVNAECVELVADRLAADQEQIELALGQHLCTDSNPCGAVVTAEPDGQWRITDDWHTEVYHNTGLAIAAAKAWGG
jgi:hypothetical protein